MWEGIAVDVGSLCTVASIIVAIIIYLEDRKRTIENETIRGLSEIFDDYYDLHLKDIKKDVNENYHEIVKFMGKTDRFFATVNRRYGKRIIKKRASAFFCRQYDSYMQNIIEQRRKQFKRDDYYISIEQMVAYLKKDSKTNNS